MKDVFAKTACMFLKGVKLESIGGKLSAFFPKKHSLPTVTNNNKTIHAQIIYIDRFGNSISNISKKYFKELNPMHCSVKKRGKLYFHWSE